MDMEQAQDNKPKRDERKSIYTNPGDSGGAPPKRPDQQQAAGDEQEMPRGEALGAMLAELFGIPSPSFIREDEVVNRLYKKLEKALLKFGRKNGGDLNAGIVGDAIGTLYCSVLAGWCLESPKFEADLHDRLINVAGSHENLIRTLVDGKRAGEHADDPVQPLQF